MMTMAELARALPQAALQGDGRVRFARVSTDSRTTEAGALFVALRGERFDGHDHVEQAVARGAVALLVERIGSAGPPTAATSSISPATTPGDTTN